MTAQLALQNLLRARFAESQRTNPRYSVRAYSRKVGVHFASLSAILNGKRSVSKKLATRIADRLCLDPQERSELLGLFPEKKTAWGAGSPPSPHYLQLNAQQFKIAAEWEHFAVLSLMRCVDFESDPAWIAHRLGITEARARQVVKRLLDLEILSNDGGRLKRATKSYRTSDDTPSLSLKKCHEQSLEIARESLYRDSVDERDFTSVTIAMSPKKMKLAKELIRRFEDGFCDAIEQGERTEVYRLAIQLFPLTKLKNQPQTGDES